MLLTRVFLREQTSFLPQLVDKTKFCDLSYDYEEYIHYTCNKYDFSEF